MVISKVRGLRTEKEGRDGDKLTYDRLVTDTGLSRGTWNALLAPRAVVKRIDGKTLDVLCRYFGCQIGDILEYVPGEPGK